MVKASDLEKIRRRKKRARVIMIVLLAAVLAAAVALFTAYHAKDHYLAAKLDRAFLRVQNKTGLAVRYSGFSSNMTSYVRLKDVTVSSVLPAGEKPLAAVDRVEVRFELSANESMPIRVHSVELTNPLVTLALDRAGRPDLPEPVLEKLREALGGPGGPSNGEASEGKGTVDRILESLLDLNVAVKDGRLNLVDEHYARRGPGRLSVTNLTGYFFVDILGKSISSNAHGEIEGGGGRFNLHALFSAEKKVVELAGEDLSLAFLEPYLPDRVSVGKGSRLNGRVNIASTKGSSVLPIGFDGEVRNLTLEDARLAQNPIRDASVRTRGTLMADLKSRRFKIDDGKFFMGAAVMDASGVIQFPQGKKPVFEVTLNTEKLPIQSALDAIPADFIPVIRGAKVEGEADLSFHLLLDLNNSSATQIDPKVEVRGFRVAIPPPKANVRKLKEPFEHKVYKNGQYVKTILVGSDNPDFVPFNDLGKILIGAVLTCEDGRFFHHHGIVLDHVRESIKTNISREGFRRGASTVSMQTVKNLFLTPEKTASRKFQEMLLTYWMEQEIPKERILEIYMNIIEWGPMIYGVGPASKHYFGKKPDNLSPLQAAFLGSIIANPVAYHRFYERGSVGNWTTMLSFVLTKMSERGTMAPEEVDWCEPFEPQFSKDGSPAKGGCEPPEEGSDDTAVKQPPAKKPEKPIDNIDLLDVDGDLLK